jgi:lysyl-tRNA synthetase class 1
MKQSLFWADQLARQIVDREKKLKRGTRVYRTEMGVGASGIPHVGSAGDGVRNYVVNLALKDAGAKSEFIAFADDRDGLRKVPLGFPTSLEKEIGKPVSLIKDPFGCHKSFADHFANLLITAFKQLGLTFILKRAHEVYARGELDREITEILTHAKDAGRIIHKITGQEKYLTALPFLPICKKCKRIYTTTAYAFNPATKKVFYKCDQEFIGKNSNTGKEIPVKGCGFEGECSIRDGKVAWKAEFACRWRALKIQYEAYGKDILDSVKTNDVICRDILHYEPPVHSLYEMFIERGGKKISKTGTQVFTPEMWLSYASPESLRLLFLKRLRTTRVVAVDAIPAYMDEVDALARIYCGEVTIENKRELEHNKRLFVYVHLLKPKKKGLAVPYNTIVTLLKLAKDTKVVKAMLSKSGLIPAKLTKEDEQELQRRLGYVKRWVADTESASAHISFSEKQRNVLHTLAREIEKKSWKEKELEQRLYEVGKREGFAPKEFFKTVYLALLQSEQGPRLAPFILTVGQKRVAGLLKKV